MDGGEYTVQSVCFSPDCTTLASGSVDCFIYLWNVKVGSLKAKFYGHSGGVNSVRFSPDGTKLASCSKDKSIKLWDVKTG